MYGKANMLTDHEAEVAISKALRAAGIDVAWLQVKFEHADGPRSFMGGFQPSAKKGGVE